MPAPIALPEVAAQDRGPAVANISQRALLFARQHGFPASQKLALVGAEDIGQFQPMLSHHSMGMRSSDSNDSRGLGVERMATSATRR
jgi:hypothetical protein